MDLLLKPSFVHIQIYEGDHDINIVCRVVIHWVPSLIVVVSQWVLTVTKFFSDEFELWWVFFSGPPCNKYSTCRYSSLRPVPEVRITLWK